MRNIKICKHCKKLEYNMTLKTHLCKNYIDDKYDSYEFFESCFVPFWRRGLPEKCDFKLEQTVLNREKKCCFNAFVFWCQNKIFPKRKFLVSDKRRHRKLTKKMHEQLDSALNSLKEIAKIWRPK